MWLSPEISILMASLEARITQAVWAGPVVPMAAPVVMDSINPLPEFPAMVRAGVAAASANRRRMLGQAVAAALERPASQVKTSPILMESGERNSARQPCYRLRGVPVVAAVVP